MHFPHSNLFDQCSTFNSYFTAHHCGTSGTIPHGLTAAHGIYWNMSGFGTRGGTTVSQQARYGYIIGTGGTRFGVSTTTGGNTAPVDHVEGVGQATELEPQSLYLDQLAKRSQGILLSVGPDEVVPPTFAHPLTASGLTLTGSDGLSFSHPKNPNAPTNLSASYEWSPDLVNWYGHAQGPDGGPSLNFDVATAESTSVVTATPSEELPQVFFRLRVNLNE